MAEEEAFENLDSLDWSDVESELKAVGSEMCIRDRAESSGQKKKKEGEDDEAEGDSTDPLSKGDIDINFLFDVQLSIIVEVGRTQMLISDLLELEEQSIIELDSMVGQPLDIRANDLLVARGEVIVVNEKFAVRITDIISPDNRFEAL